MIIGRYVGRLHVLAADEGLRKRGVEMPNIGHVRRPSRMVTFYHDIEQDLDGPADVQLCREVVKGMLALEATYDVKATYNVVGVLFDQQPDLIEWILSKGHEVALHSWSHPSEIQSMQYARQVRLCRAVSTPVYGYRSPMSRCDESTLEALRQEGFKWSAEDDRQHDEPYYIYKGLVRCPVAGDDWPVQEGRMTEDEWLRHFKRLLRRKAYVAFGTHDVVTSRKPEQRLAAWEQILAAAKAKHSRIVTFSEATDLFRRASISRYYRSTAKAWNKTNKGYYRTKRFRELIKEEASKMDRPVVADLGWTPEQGPCGYGGENLLR